jgi:hypothetical protein
MFLLLNDNKYGYKESVNIKYRGHFKNNLYHTLTDIVNIYSLELLLTSGLIMMLLKKFYLKKIRN